jgi:hypothetical protein
MLTTMLLAAATAAFPAAGTYRYTAALNGQRIGEWAVTVKAGNGDTEIDESSSANVAGMALSATAVLVLGPDLRRSDTTVRIKWAVRTPASARY